MAIPHIRIVERADAVSTTTINPRNRMAILGEFSSGPANTPLLIGSVSEFARIFRSDNKKGSIAFQAAYDQIVEPQGADYVLLRVMGHQIQAAASILFSGVATKANTLNLNFSYVGSVNNNNTLALLEEVTFNQVYNGSSSGRMHFYVSNIADYIATIKYEFKFLNDTTAIDWSSVTDSISVDLKHDQFLPIAVADGLTVTFGISGQTADLALQLGNEFSVRINKYNYTLPISVGETPYNIAVNLQNQLSGVEPLGVISITADNDGVVLKAIDDYPGISGNRLTFTATLTDTVSPGVSLTVASNNFAGGVAGPTKAYRDFCDINGDPLVRIQAKYEGVYGNNLKLSIKYLAPGVFNLDVVDVDGGSFNPPILPENFNVDLSTVESDGYVRSAEVSNLVDIVFLPRILSGENYDPNLLKLNPERLNRIDLAETDPDVDTHPDHFGPNYLSNLYLTSGNNGPAVTDQDFIDALSTLDAVAVNYVLAAGQYSNPVRQALIAHCENKIESDGLRIAVLAADPGLRPSAARLQVANYDSKHAVMVAGWATYGAQVNSPRYGTEGAAFYLGKMVSLPFYMSPAYKVGARAVRNIIECDTDPYISKPDLDKFEEAGLEVLTKSKVYNGYFFTTGSLLSNDNNWNRVMIRRAYNQVRMDLYDLLEQYTAAPYRRETVMQILTSINNYFLSRQTRGEIAGFSNAYVAGTDDIAGEYRRGRLNINVGFLPLSALDYIEIGIFRDDNGGVVLSGL